jgi:hypothetical protein
VLWRFVFASLLICFVQYLSYVFIMSGMKARVAERGQVERLCIKPGTLLEFSEERGRLIAIKSEATDSVAAVYGCLGKSISTEAVMARLRGRK